MSNKFLKIFEENSLFLLQKDVFIMIFEITTVLNWFSEISYADIFDKFISDV